MLPWWHCQVLPFVKSPETHPTFEIYFTRPWLDTFTLSLNNFLSTVLQNIPLPTLLSFDDEQLKLRAMADEIETLRSKAWESYASTDDRQAGMQVAVHSTVRCVCFPCAHKLSCDRQRLAISTRLVYERGSNSNALLPRMHVCMYFSSFFFLKRLYIKKKTNENKNTIILTTSATCAGSKSRRTQRQQQRCRRRSCKVVQLASTEWFSRRSVSSNDNISKSIL